MKKVVLVTGGYGFIGINFIKLLLKKNFIIINVDKITYASKHNYKKFKLTLKSKNYFFYKYNICNEKKISSIIKKYKPKYFFNFAAESHVDNSISKPRKFINTNIIGTYSLLQAIKNSKLNLKKIKFIQISTDEVFGDVKKKKRKSYESDPYLTSSPYSAAKAAADHFVKAWSRTFGIKYNITYSCNNYGYFQNSEKFIPTIINSVLKNKKIPIYGNGLQKREWIFVEDNVLAIYKIGFSNISNQSFNISSKIGITNLKLVKIILNILIKQFGYDKKIFKLISYVKDRPGHDLEYKISNKKIEKYFSWSPKINLERGLVKTISWYLYNK
jgi:dTDP-glucose 4,6-dehydratase